MTILNEPIAIWISIAAFLISLSTLLLTRRKQRYDERTSLAKQIADIKAKYGEELRVIQSLVADLSKFEEVVKDAVQGRDKNAGMPIQIHTVLSSMVEMENEVKTVYDKIGYCPTKTTDPVILAAIAVNCEVLTKQLEFMRNNVQTMTRELETVMQKCPTIISP